MVSQMGRSIPPQATLQRKFPVARWLADFKGSDPEIGVYWRV
jgi:hypothetical protein